MKRMNFDGQCGQISWLVTDGGSYTLNGATHGVSTGVATGSAASSTIITGKLSCDMVAA